MRPILHRRSFAISLALLIPAGCGSPTPGPLASPELVVAVASEAPVVSPPPATARPVLPEPAVSELALEVHQLGSELAGHVSAVVSLGDQIVWAGGRGSDDNNLYRFIPGVAQPELLFDNPRHDSTITTIAGSATGYVFTDERSADGQPEGWVLWYLAAGTTEPVMLDHSTDDTLPAPTLAMSDDFLAWEVMHGTRDDRTNELIVAAMDGQPERVTLLSISGDASYIEFPGLWVDELWYGIVDNDWDAGAEYPRIEMIDLHEPEAEPTVYGADQRAFMPAPGRDVVAWKSGGQTGLSAVNSGELTLYWRDSRRTDNLSIPGPASAADRITFPSVGNRFVAWWDDIHPRFYLYDLRELRFRRVAEYDWAGDEAIARPSVSGDLLAYLHDRGDGNRTLEWSWLPD